MTNQILAENPAGEHGSAFTAHMISATWRDGEGWSPLETVALADIPMHPGTIGLHYGQVVFEGLKAHRQPDGSMAVFRPAENAQRFQRSSRRLAMPELPEEMFLAAVEEIVRADEHLLPDDPSLSLYLRPLMFASEANLMLRPAREYRFLMMAFVAGGFFGGAVEAVRVWVNRAHPRAFPGGTGDVKCAANYAGAFLAQREAEEAGCRQVVWLDATERRWVEELGGMNLFFVRDGRIITPRLTGTLLPGVTRKTLLALAESLGHPVSEDQLSLDQWRDECRAGSLTETFACGTAAVVTPVGGVVDGEDGWTVGDGTPGPVTMGLRHALLDLQQGRLADPHGWMHPVRGT
ncbi:branched-chain amino acid aminotransferase [Lentzea kentuckyensis]|uniref:branched-chain amino acid aminotransferase n=1 Tax=Lentzea kentuckyensis TaxID=360086 RepID=UPI000A364204|nr:branched-chain amino acid aminotransferase [Lentzea kentuckyensis]